MAVTMAELKVVRSVENLAGKRAYSKAGQKVEMKAEPKAASWALTTAVL